MTLEKQAALRSLIKLSPDVTGHFESNPNAIDVLLYLAINMDNNNTLACTKYDLRMGSGVKMVDQAVRDLKQTKFLDVITSTGGQPNIYLLNKEYITKRDHIERGHLNDARHKAPSGKIRDIKTVKVRELIALLSQESLLDLDVSYFDNGTRNHVAIEGLVKVKEYGADEHTSVMLVPSGVVYEARPPAEVPKPTVKTQDAPLSEYMRIKEVTQMLSLSVATIYKKMNDGEFPQSVKFGSHTVRWVRAEVDQWMAEKKSKRNNS